MKHQILIGTLLAGGFLMSQSSFAQVQLVKNSKPTSRIIVAGSDSTDMKAASLLQDFIQKVSGAQIPIVKNTTAKKNDIAIGTASNPTLASNRSITSQLKEDGFLISTNDGVLRILSGGDKGSIYAVVTLLENELDIQYFGENEYNAPKQQTIEIPKLEVIDNPAFRYRQSQNYAMGTDPVYKL
ncbi:MAG: alpha-glucuronidase family glycosyl hydrolase, partial [Tannerellaceae bacterium]